MTAFIEYAIPTDEAALEKIRKDNDTNRILALDARKLYPEYITHYKNFKCTGCDAPISCRALDSNSDIAPVFIEQSRSENLHNKDCMKNPDKMDKINNQSRNNTNSYKNSKEDIFKTNITKNGFTSRKINGSSQQRSNEHTSKSTKINVNSKVNRGHANSEKKVKTNLNTLSQLVHEFYYNPNAIIKTRTTTIKISQLFRRIEQNKFYTERKKQKYCYIHHGKGFINKTKVEGILSIKFGSKIRINEKIESRPSFKVNEEFIQKNYPDIYDRFLSNENELFDIYTTLPFLQNGEYINFSSFNKKEEIICESVEFKDNFYIY